MTVPPDPEEMNEERAAWAGKALKSFRRVTGADPEDALADLLCDLMHWADRNGADFAAQLARAQANYGDETMDDLPPAPLDSRDSAKKGV